MSKPITLTPGGQSAGAFIVPAPRPGDTVGDALRSAFANQRATPDDMLMMLGKLDRQTH